MENVVELNVLLILLIIISILIIYYLVNTNVNYYINTNNKYSSGYLIAEISSNRSFNVFDKNTFSEINDFFEKTMYNWDTNRYGKFNVLTKPLVENVDTVVFQLGIPQIIPSNTMIIFPENDGIHWSNGFHLKCSVTKKLFYPEPNSNLLWEHDLIVVSGDRSRIKLLVDKILK